MYEGRIFVEEEDVGIDLIGTATVEFLVSTGVMSFNDKFNLS